MEYSFLRLNFNTGVHFGEDALEDSSTHLRADTIFSAMCIEALEIGGEELLDKLVSFVRNGKLLLSDAFPLIKNEYYLPKPIYSVQAETEHDSSAKKVFKKLSYIPFDKVDEYTKGEFNENTVDGIVKKLSELGESYVHTKGAVSYEKDTLPYHVGVYTFKKDAGLYIVVGGDSDSMLLMRELFTSLSYAGIGGRRSSGLGRFSYTVENLPENHVASLTSEFPAYMTLSLSLPKKNEIESVINDSNSTYALIRRSGFVYSGTYSNEPLRKKDFYALASGSIVRNKYCGDVFDVSNKGAHPVYRYAKPLFMGVKL